MVFADVDLVPITVKRITNVIRKSFALKVSTIKAGTQPVYLVAKIVPIATNLQAYAELVIQILNLTLMIQEFALPNPALKLDLLMIHQARFVCMIDSMHHVFFHRSPKTPPALIGENILSLVRFNIKDTVAVAMHSVQCKLLSRLTL